MHGLKLTYATLEKTRNEAAVDVLLAALGDPSPETRQRALAALISRSESTWAERLFDHWQLLQADDLRVLRPKRKWLAPTVERVLRDESEGFERAIEVAQVLGIESVLPTLIGIAESSGSRQRREAATDAILELVEPIGREARIDRDQPTVRRPVLTRLADSVRRFSMHDNVRLVDAFLLVVTWGDAEFRQLIGDRSPQLELLCNRLESSTLPGIDDLIAGFLRRRKIPTQIADIIRSRDRSEFRDALLRTVGAEPTATVLRNLADIGVPTSCRGGESLLREIIPEHCAAVAQIYTAAAEDNLDKLGIVAAVAETAGPHCVATAAACLGRCDVPDSDTWMRAAVAIDRPADKASEPVADPNARLLQRLIDLLAHPDPALSRNVRRILRPLHAEEMLHRFEQLRPRTRRKLGQVVMRVDPDALQRIRDSLRHPVLRNRLAAIATADALAAVDLLSDSFEHIAREDHQEARIRAANVMSHAESETTLRLLREMVELPESPVRDAACRALERRQLATRSTSMTPEANR